MIEQLTRQIGRLAVAVQKIVKALEFVENDQIGFEGLNRGLRQHSAQFADQDGARVAQVAVDLPMARDLGTEIINPGDQAGACRHGILKPVRNFTVHGKGCDPRTLPLPAGFARPALKQPDRAFGVGQAPNQQPQDQRPLACPAARGFQIKGCAGRKADEVHLVVAQAVFPVMGSVAQIL